MINLQQNKIGPEGATALADMLESNITITNLFIHNNSYKFNFGTGSYIN